MSQIRTWAYVATLVVVGAASFAIAYFFRDNPLVETGSSAAGISALFAAIFAILRDQAAHERQLYLKRLDQAFGIGATSHMATKAFDRHIAFCDEYCQYIRDTVIPELTAHGPNGARDAAGKLSHIRRQHAPWVTNQVAAALLPFESALLHLSIDADLVKSGYRDKERVERMMRNFERILGTGDANAKPESAVAIEAIFSDLRAALGIDELAALRSRLLASAMSAKGA